MTFISDFNTASPANSDARANGAAEIRNVKTVVQDSFPNIGGPVDTSHTDINTAVAAVLDGGLGTTDVTGLMPKGAILMWSGAVGSIPAGWTLCDGKADVNGVVIPDLGARFIVGYKDLDGDFGAVGNSNDDTDGAARSHDHGAETSTDSVDMTVSIDGWGVEQSSGKLPEPTTSGKLITGSGLEEVGEDLESLAHATEDQDLTDSHSHTISSDGHLPPYYTLAYIIYVGTV